MTTSPARPTRWRLYLYRRGDWMPDRGFPKRAAAVRAGKRVVRDVRNVQAYKVEREP